ncbi:hypothetical protein D9M70_629030 [compost metagenome]
MAGSADLQAFRETTKKAWALCSWKANIAGTIFGDETHFKETTACVEESLSSASSTYAAADPAAKQAVKPYYAKWLASMKSLPALQSASKAEIQRSISESGKALEEAWALVELEYPQ